jgi:ABC-type lipoprotein release transport system permease subunit
MLIGETLLIALQSIRANLFRASLTMLGIIIGVAAVITMVALGTGARAAIDAQMEALGGDILSISASSWFHRGVARDQRTLTTGESARRPGSTAALRAISGH